MDPSSQYISLEMLDLTKQSDALQISSMFPKFQMHVIVQELILSDYDVNKTVDVLLNKTDEIVDNRASSSSTRSPVTTNQLPRSPSVKKTISNTSENTNKTKKSSPPSYEETLRMLNDDSAIISKSSSKKCTKISTEISKSNTKINPKIDSKPNKSYPKFTTVQNKQLILLPLPDDFLRLNISNTISDVSIKISQDTTQHATNSQTIDSPTHFRLSEVRTISSPPFQTPFSNNNSSNTVFSNNISSNNNSSNTTSRSSKNSHICSPECPNSHRYEALPPPRNEIKTNPEPTMCPTNLDLEPPPAPLPRHPTPQCTNSKPEFSNSKDEGWQRFD